MSLSMSYPSGSEVAFLAIGAFLGLVAGVALTLLVLSARAGGETS